MKQRRRSRLISLSLTMLITMSIAVLGVDNPVSASTSSAVALRIADYAVATATHDNPSHVVTAADVSNAAGIDTVNTANLIVLINLDDVFGYSRLVLFFQEMKFSDICVDLPATIGAPPRLIKCPRQAKALWDVHGGALAVSNRAIAAAARKGRAVSGADVVVAAKSYGVTFRRKPTFKSGEGGTVDFETVDETANAKFKVDTCVQLPRTAYGLPVLVPC